MEKENYILIYDQVEQFEYRPMGLCEKGNLREYLDKRYKEIRMDYQLFNNMILVERASESVAVYLFKNLDEIEKYKDNSIKEIEEMILDGDLKIIKEKRKNMRNRSTVTTGGSGLVADKSNTEFSKTYPF